MANYELLILGTPPPGIRDILTLRLIEVADQFGMLIPDDLAVRSAPDAGDRNATASTAALYFGGHPAADVGLIDELETACVPIVPVVSEGEKVSMTIPAKLQAINAFFFGPFRSRTERARRAGFRVPRATPSTATRVC